MITAIPPLHRHSTHDHGPLPRATSVNVVFGIWRAILRWQDRHDHGGLRLGLPVGSWSGVTVRVMSYPLTAAQANLAELVAEAQRSHRPVTISEHGRPVAVLINVDDLADLEDRAALAAHLADKAAGRGGIGLEELDAALDRIDAERIS
jgi:prevent-host-death family protein